MVNNQDFVLPTGRGAKRFDALYTFAQKLLEVASSIGFKVSARGWCYQLESFTLINKGQFDYIEGIINQCRDIGLLPIDFVAEEDARRFSGVETPLEETPMEFMGRYLKGATECEEWYTPDWWDGEEYYIQMIVEKIDIKTLFEPVCWEYHIPIATTKGWSSKLQRAEYARRFKEAEDKGLRCVLLYCGDHDPDGLRISEFLHGNLNDLKDIVWSDGTLGYDPTELTIDRFGLNYDFIVNNDLTWIDNLITGSKRNLADASHPNHFLPYVQEYLAMYGARKCEANALIVRPRESEELCRQVIESYIGIDAKDRFAAKRQEIRDVMTDFRQRTGLDNTIEEALKLIQAED